MADSVSLPPLPWPDNALDPVISANTISFHYGKHHKAYVDNFNKLLPGSEFEGQPPEAIVKATAGKPDKAPFFNNAGQVWNHNFYWKCLKANGGGMPKGDLADKINAAFGSYDNFKKEFANTCVTQFGSGWGWLVAEGGAVKLVKTSNADTPMTKGQTALLTIDVWEHAYYLDYQNRRPDHVNAVIDKLLNWDFAADNLAKA